METTNTSPEATQARVTEKAKKKGKSKVNKTFKTLKKLKVVYRKVSDLKANDYNPNRQSDHDFELLCKSMEEDGFTQPVVVHEGSKEVDRDTIVDGEHRWRAAQALGYDEIPIVYVSMTVEQMRIATLRHNRARGSEDMELTADVLRDLEKLGALDWAQDSLMLDDVELQRLLDDIPAPDALAGEEFNDGWVPDEITDEDAANAQGNDPTAGHTIKEDADGTVHVTGMSKDAADQIREGEKKIKEASNQEERNMAQKQRGLFRISLVFAGDDAAIVKEMVADNPAERIVEFCKLAKTMTSDPAVTPRPKTIKEGPLELGS